MYTTAEMQTALKEHKGSLRELARRAQVDHTTLCAIRDGDTKNPRLDTFQRIVAALKPRRGRKAAAKSGASLP